MRCIGFDPGSKMIGFAVIETVRIPVQTVSEANQREHWRKRHSRQRAQSEATGWALISVFGRRRHNPVTFPVVIRLTRISKGNRRLDKDNLAGSFKHVQDSVAKFLGVDDGDRSKVDWDYDQKPGDAYSVLVEFLEAR